MFIGFNIGYVALISLIIAVVLLAVLTVVEIICKRLNLFYDTKEVINLGVIILFCVASIYLFLSYFIITNDVSLDEKLWFNSSSKEIYEKNDYILFNIDDERISYKKIIKKVACIEGDKVRITDDIVYCNDTAIGKLLKEDKNGKPLYPFTQESEIIIPKDYYFVIGTDTRSYDSRYFGLVYINRIITEVKPIL